MTESPRSLGVRRTEHEAVDGATLTVETPEFHGDERIGVAAYAYDDERGDIELTLGTDIRIHLTLSPTAARQLADRLADAADEASAAVDEE